MDGQFKQPPEMDFSHEGNLAERWKRWKQTMNLYLEVAMSDKTDKEQCKAVLYVIGLDGREIFNTFTFENEEVDKLVPLMQKFEDYCTPKKNVTVIRHRFNTRVQGSTESIDKYLTDLKLIAKNCEFEHLKDGLIRDRIVCGTNSSKIKERLLREDNLTLDKAVSICRADEMSRSQMKTLHNDEQVHALRKKQVKQRKEYNDSGAKQKYEKPAKNAQNESYNCRKCGTTHGKRNCPAYGKRCHRCKRLNHFGKFCNSKSARNVHGLDEDSSSDSETETKYFVGSINKKTEIQEDACYASFKIQGKTIKFKIDTGAQVNILPLSIFRKLSNVRLHKTSTTLTSYSGDKLRVAGKCSLSLKDKPFEFFVTDTNQSPILGFKASNELSLIQVIMTVQRDVNDPIKSFPKVFSGLGCLEKPYKIEIDKSVTPVINAPRKIPAALREKLKGTLQEMEEEGVIRKVDEPTDWVNSLVVVEKPKTGKLRVCLDPRNLNPAIKREHFVLPTIEDITTRLTGATVMSKLDANNGYWQLRLDEESQLLTTFNSPFGRYCFMRVPFGLRSSQDVFQKRISQIFDGLEGVETDIDDILVWGRTREEHDNRLRAVLKRCEDVGLTLNPDKCQFRVSEITYIGHTLSAEGVRPCKEKVKAIREMPAPCDKKGVQRLLGTVNYVAKFVPNMSIITEPIRSLLRDDVEFVWTHEQEKAFKKLKDILTENPVLTFYDVNKPVTVSCDSSQTGLGAVLLQDNKPVAYASRSLTDTESRYANIERELLAVLFGLERFNDYTYGKHVLVQSDHSPLQMIVRKPLGNAPPRLQRMLLRLQKYDFSLNYKPGKLMVVPDMLSRASIKEEKSNDLENDIQCFVNMVVKSTPMTDRNLEEIKVETSKDEGLQILKQVIRNGWPEDKNGIPKEIDEYWNSRDELSEIDGLITKGEKIVIPAVMRRSMLNKLHEGHLGIEKTRKLAREFVFWPGINAQITDYISKCSICLEHRNSNTKEPMTESEQSDMPWSSVSTDIFHWNNQNYVIIVDYYSRYFELARLESLKSSCVITHMKSIFARHGIPTIVRSDNGPQYVSAEFKEFEKSWGFQHKTSSPHYQQSNGLAERFVQSVKKMLTKAKQDGKDPYLSILMYRNTPIENLGSPAQMLMNRRLRSTLPTTKKRLEPKCRNKKTVKKSLKQQKQKQKHYYDQHSKPMNQLHENDTIRFQYQPKSNWQPGKVVKSDTNNPKSYVVRTPEGCEYRRNRRHIIKTNENFDEQSYSDDNDTINDMSDTENNTDRKPSEGQYVTRSGRTIRKPQRLIEEK